MTILTSNVKIGGMDRKRYLADFIESLCFERNLMAFVSGPRQCGKTTMSKRMLRERKSGEYYNWDETAFRRLWTKDPKGILQIKRSENKPLIVLDEIHKASLWKRSLKGIYDTMTSPYDLIVTGSARLKVYQKGGDSLMGRYLPFRLHPLSLGELLRKKFLLPDDFLDHLFEGVTKHSKRAREGFELLMQFGPFPAPLLDGSQKFLRLWRRNRMDQVIREDLRDLSRLPELSQVEMLVTLLPERVGSLLSIQGLCEILEVSYPTIVRWMRYLYELYVCFEVMPYTKSLSRSYKKQKKIYLWDWSSIEDEAAKFENLIAFHLLKYCHFLTDTGEGEFQLFYLRSRDHQEIDFLIVREGKPWLPVEVKLGSKRPSSSWKYFLKQISCDRAIQVTMEKEVHKIVQIEESEVLVISADTFLQNLV